MPKLYEHKDAMGWLQPWPLGFHKHQRKWKWRIEFLTMGQVRKLHSCWGIPGPGKASRLTMQQCYNRIVKNKEPLKGKGHQIDSYARYGIKRPTIVVIDGIVWDGNHTACALMRAGYSGKVMAFIKGSLTSNKRVNYKKYKNGPPPALPKGVQDAHPKGLERTGGG